MIPNWETRRNIQQPTFGDSHLLLMKPKRLTATANFRFRLYGRPKSCYNIPTPHWFV